MFPISINAWCLDHCFIFVRHTFVSNLISCHTLMALQCLFTEVIGVVCKWSRRTRIWFWQEFNPWLSIGDRFQTHLWQEQISAASLIEIWSLFMMLMSSMLYVSCPHQSSIIFSSSIVPVYNYHLLIDRPHIFVCHISQDNVFCAHLALPIQFLRNYRRVKTYTFMRHPPLLASISYVIGTTYRCILTRSSSLFTDCYIVYPSLE